MEVRGEARRRGGHRRAWRVSASHGALAIVGIFLVLGTLYSVATPVLEASDEFKHYPYVQYVQTHRRLPILEPEVCQESPTECPWLQDGGQPPAYYVLMAAATSWIDTSDLPELLWKNKHAFIGHPTQVCNKNLIIHQPEQEAFPWTGSVLAVHLSRFLTVLFGAGTVFLTYLLARQLFPRRPSLALGAAALTAFNPMFLFVSGSVNNDAMAACLGSWALLTMVQMVGGGGAKTRAQMIRQSAWLGLLIGLGILTKLSLLGLIPLALLVVTARSWQQYRTRSLRLAGTATILHGLLVVLVSGAVSGWWFVRNWRIYGDPTGLNAFIAIQGRRAHPPTMVDWLGEFGTFRWTYWGLFGGVNVMAPRAIYWFFDLLTLVAWVGLIGWAARHWREGMRPCNYDILIPIAWAVTLFVSVLRWTWISPAFQGRLVFPGIGGVSTLLILGLRQWSPPRHRAVLTGGIGAILLVVAGLLPFVAIRPAYAQPEPLMLADVPDGARVEPVDIGTVARVVGVGLEPQTIDPDEEQAYVDAVVYWQALQPDGRDVVSFARLLGQDHQLLGQVNRHPACGMVPTSLWESGQVWRDPYHIPVADDAEAPTQLRVEIGLYRPEADETLGAMEIGKAKLAPPEPAPGVGHPLNVRLADGVTLQGYDLSPSNAQPGETLTATLYWKARGNVSRDYQVFVHLTGDEPQPLIQDDGPPSGGDYPTSLWAAGETIADPHSLVLPRDLPAGDYRLLVGMYDLTSMERLPRSNGSAGTVQIPVTLESN